MVYFASSPYYWSFYGISSIPFTSRIPTAQKGAGEHVKYVNTNELKYWYLVASRDKLSIQFKRSYKTDMLPGAVASMSFGIEGIIVLTQFENKIKNRFVTCSDKLLMKKRALIQSVIF